MNFSKVSIIGSGWSGLALARKLRKEGREVVVTSRSSARKEALAQEGIRLEVLDVLSDEFLQAITMVHSEVFEADLVIVTITPPKSDRVENAAQRGHEAIARQLRLHGVKQAVLLSSTGAYPNLNRDVFEDDAATIVSRHSGVSILALEEAYNGLPICIFRMGGLAGPGREPNRMYHRNGMITNSKSPVNVTWLRDILGVIGFLCDVGQMSGVYNLVDPELLTKEEFVRRYNSEPLISSLKFDNQLAEWKRVRSDRIMSFGYQFVS
ncbi:NAD-dependent epimerase/dehydratase family protein [Sanyastnella coralliicola]|uniref:NAD-dependent epimerase/dehydratase family protein n=1 Tax=Sanyastnella coralliicola TaxID=3069118 RepID=UPI0027B9E784|nr:NAD-dependent epimerase/dehydratase family protein [Longitalea sp. SCSIO 12813]